MDNIIVIADAHLQDNDRDLKKFISFLDFVKRNSGTLFILGDLFEFWLGSKRLIREYQKPVIDKLFELKQEGIILNYVEGNRDFRLERLYCKKIFKEICSDFMVREISDKRFLFTHGDTVNRVDRQYLLWRKFIKKPFLNNILNFVPKKIGLKVASLLEEKLKFTNKDKRMYYPVNEIYRFGYKKVEDGFDIIILGHFHHEEELIIKTDNRKGILYTIGDWKRKRRYLIFEDGENGKFNEFN